MNYPIYNSGIRLILIQPKIPCRTVNHVKNYHPNHNQISRKTPFFTPTQLNPLLVSQNITTKHKRVHLGPSMRATWFESFQVSAMTPTKRNTKRVFTKPQNGDAIIVFRWLFVILPHLNKKQTTSLPICAEQKEIWDWISRFQLGGYPDNRRCIAATT